MSAIGMTLVLGATALAVDVASLFVERRHAQGAVDLAAVAAANDLTRAREAALATLRANNITQTDGVVVEVGSYKADPDSRGRPALCCRRQPRKCRARHAGQARADIFRERLLAGAAHAARAGHGNEYGSGRYFGRQPAAFGT